MANNMCISYKGYQWDAGQLLDEDRETHQLLFTHAFSTKSLTTEHQPAPLLPLADELYLGTNDIDEDTASQLYMWVGFAAIYIKADGKFDEKALDSAPEKARKAAAAGVYAQKPIPKPSVGGRRVIFRAVASLKQCKAEKSTKNRQPQVKFAVLVEPAEGGMFKTCTVKQVSILFFPEWRDDSQTSQAARLEVWNSIIRQHGQRLLENQGGPVDSLNRLQISVEEDMHSRIRSLLVTHAQSPEPWQLDAAKDLLRRFAQTPARYTDNVAMNELLEKHELSEQMAKRLVETEIPATWSELADLEITGSSIQELSRQLCQADITVPWAYLRAVLVRWALANRGGDEDEYPVPATEVCAEVALQLGAIPPPVQPDQLDRDPPRVFVNCMIDVLEKAIIKGRQMVAAVGDGKHHGQGKTLTEILAIAANTVDTEAFKRWALEVVKFVSAEMDARDKGLCDYLEQFVELLKQHRSSWVEGSDDGEEASDESCEENPKDDLKEEGDEFIGMKMEK